MPNWSCPECSQSMAPSTPGHTCIGGWVEHKMTVDNSPPVSIEEVEKALQEIFGVINTSPVMISLDKEVAAIITKAFNTTEC